MSDAFGVPKPPVPPAPGPRLIHDGLAVYARGTGEPLFLMPYPHGFTSGPITEGSLATLLKGLGHCVVSFDPPGAHASTRPPRVDMPEMLSCATEALDALHIQGPVDTVGHSMGGLCALALAINRPERVRRLVLVGSGSGGPSLRRHRAMPWNWSLVSLDFWRYAFWGHMPALARRHARRPQARRAPRPRGVVRRHVARPSHLHRCRGPASPSPCTRPLASYRPAPRLRPAARRGARTHPCLCRTLRPPVPARVRLGARSWHPWRTDGRLRAQWALPA